MRVRPFLTLSATNILECRLRPRSGELAVPPSVDWTTLCPSVLPCSPSGIYLLAVDNLLAGVMQLCKEASVTAQITLLKKTEEDYVGPHHVLCDTNVFPAAFFNTVQNSCDVQEHRKFSWLYWYRCSIIYHTHPK